MFPKLLWKILNIQKSWKIRQCARTHMFKTKILPLTFCSVCFLHISPSIHPSIYQFVLFFMQFKISCRRQYTKPLNTFSMPLISSSSVFTCAWVCMFMCMKTKIYLWILSILYTWWNGQNMVIVFSKSWKMHALLYGAEHHHHLRKYPHCPF